MIRQALESVLRQIHREWELFIWVDGHSPMTEQMIRLYDDRLENRTRWVHTSATSVGEANARNGLFQLWREHAPDAELACWLDDDDIMSPERLGKQGRFMTQNPKLDICFTDIGVFHPTPEVIRSLEYGMPIKPNRSIDVKKYSDQLASYKNNLATPSGMFRPSVCEVPWDPCVKYGGTDLLWLYTLVNRGYNIGYLATQLYYLRQHPDRLTKKRNELPKEEVELDLARFYAAIDAVRTKV